MAIQLTPYIYKLTDIYIVYKQHIQVSITGNRKSSLYYLVLTKYQWSCHKRSIEPIDIHLLIERIKTRCIGVMSSSLMVELTTICDMIHHLYLDLVLLTHSYSRYAELMTLYLFISLAHHRQLQPINMDDLLLYFARASPSYINHSWL